MTQPSRPSPATERTAADSQWPVDQTIPRAETVGGPPADPGAEPNFAPPEHAGEVGKLGRYRVLKELGRGGMGAVYLGYDGALDRKVALKVMLPNHAANRDARERFLREARTVAMVKSEHVVTIFDVTEERGIPFLAMQYLLGYPLDQYLKTRGELPLAQVLRVGRETALGLVAAHELGLVHRDIKPGNLWLEAPKGRVKLLDFGLARIENDDVHLTNSGAVMGTPAYMSPEQARGLKVDHRTDLFSLGVVLYRLASGQMPFTGDTVMAVLTSLAVDTPTPVRELNPEVPEALEAVINRLLAKDPADRFQTAMEVVVALRAVEQPKPSARPLQTVPMAINVQPQNVWEEIDASSSNPQVLESGAGPAPASAPAPKPKRKTPARKSSYWPILLACVGLLAAAVLFAVVTIKTPRGTLVIETDDPDIEVVVKKDGAVIRDRTKDREIELKVGEYTVELAEKKDGLRLNTDKFEITGNGKARVRVWLEKPKVSPAPDPDRKAAEYALSIGGRVKVNGQEKAILALADLPKDRFSLTGADVSGKKVGDAGLANFKNCINLTYLHMSNTGVSDADVSYFKDCKNLTYLNLSGTQVSGLGVAHFKDCKNLTHLDLSYTTVGDAGLVHLEGLSNLANLGLRGSTARGSRITEPGLKKLAEKLPRCKIEWDGGIIEPTVAADPDRKAAEYVLSVGGGVSVNGGDVNMIKPDDKLIKAVADLPKNRFTLTSVDLDRNEKVTDAGMASFKGCKDLIYLGLGNTQVGDAALAPLKDCNKLFSLKLGNTLVTDAGLAHFKDCKQLTHLNVAKTKVTAKGVAAFAKALPKCRIEWDGPTIEPTK